MERELSGLDVGQTSQHTWRLAESRQPVNHRCQAKLNVAHRQLPRNELPSGVHTRHHERNRFMG